MAIVTRAGKGSALSHVELDGNFTDLDGRTTLAWAMEGVEPDVRSGDPEGAELNLFRNGIYAYSYFDGQVTQSFANFDLPLSWATGTDIYAAVHWSPGNQTLTGTVRFGLEFVYAPVNGAFGASTTIYIQSPADGTAYKHYQAVNAEGDKFPGSMASPNMRFLVRIFRDGAHVSDTFTGDIFIIGIDFYYQINRFGTQSFTPPYT